MTAAPARRSMAVVAACAVIAGCSGVYSLHRLITEADAIQPLPDRFVLKLSKDSDPDLYVREGWRYGGFDHDGSLQGYLAVTPVWEGGPTDEFIIELSEANEDSDDKPFFFFVHRQGDRYTLQGLHKSELEAWIEGKKPSKEPGGDEDDIYVDSLLELRTLHRIASQVYAPSEGIVLTLTPGDPPMFVGEE